MPPCIDAQWQRCRRGKIGRAVRVWGEKCRAVLPQCHGCVRYLADRTGGGVLVELADIDGTTHCRVYRDGVLVGLLAVRDTQDAGAILDALRRTLRVSVREPPAPPVVQLADYRDG